jgi:hypothetical protein
MLKEKFILQLYMVPYDIHHISDSLKTILVKILKFFYADPESRMEKFGSGMEKIWIRDPG